MMSFAELMQFLLAAVSTYVSLLNTIQVFGVPLMYVIVFFGLLSMVLIIVFRVKVGNLFDE